MNSSLYDTTSLSVDATGHPPGWSSKGMSSYFIKIITVNLKKMSIVHHWFTGENFMYNKYIAQYISFSCVVCSTMPLMQYIDSSFIFLGWDVTGGLLYRAYIESTGNVEECFWPQRFYFKKWNTFHPFIRFFFSILNRCN